MAQFLPEVEAIKASVIRMAGAKFNVKPDHVIPSTRFVEDLEVSDELDMMEFRMMLEDYFHFDIPQADVDQMQTVQNVIDYIVIRKGPDVHSER